MKDKKYDLIKVVYSQNDKNQIWCQHVGDKFKSQCEKC